jgi:hypothetical protein
MNFDQAAGISNAEGIQAFQLTPNPAKNEVTLTLTAANMGEVRILDLTGKVVQSTTMNGLNTTLSTENLVNGVYFVTVSNGKNSTSQKLMIQK